MVSKRLGNNMLSFGFIVAEPQDNKLSSFKILHFYYFEIGKVSLINQTSVQVCICDISKII